ncbi:hypothetical protein BD289DRAFT_422914 [Coniella lustricola]|uniref:Zn(2)-C6 fungal-type domain-containing protein n=1 Tax=Coniella lustricola TaxID=2025994 RepID=A0A2T3AJY9_9PEZI|nr:hypothetical protein BD289DRAFT_422914 [Coniella lustricola]
MSIPGESRESLDLLASAAEQSSPQSRIKRNTACVSCRDSKVKCNASAAPGQPCQRCAKLQLTCVVDRSHKRVSKRSKFEELVQEVQNIKQAVAPRASATVLPPGQLPLPSLPPPTAPHTAAAPAAANDGFRLYPTAPFSAAATPISSVASFSAPAPPSRPVHQPSPNHASHALPPSIHQQMPTPSASTSSGRPSQPRALKSRVFAGHDIDLYFDKYFESFHPYLPIVRIREPDAIYQAGPVLFWVIMVTACRRVADATYVFDFLVESIKSEVWEAVSEPPMTLATINALLLLSAWPLPTIRFMKDPSNIYTSMLMNSCYLLGIQTGRGDLASMLYPAYRLGVSDEEAMYTWIGYNIVSQRISTYSGTPSTAQFCNRTLESVMDRTSSIQVPTYFYVLLQSAAFLNQLSRTMAASLEEGRGVSHHLVDHLAEDFTKVQRLMSAVDISDIDHFTILSTLLEVQVYYVVPIPTVSPETYKRNILRCHTTAQSTVRLALKLQAEIGFLSHAPHFVFRSLLTASCIIISALISHTLKDSLEAHIQQTEGSTPDLVVADAIASVRACSVQDADLAMRCSKMMESAWNVRNMLPNTELSQLDTPQFGHRMGMGLPLDCIRRWKRHMDYIRSERMTTPQPGGAAGGAAAAAAAGGTAAEGSGQTAGGDTNGGSNASTATADLAGTGGGAGSGTASGASVASTLAPPDPTSMIDWDAFMKDFDWNFDPSLIETVVS